MDPLCRANGGKGTFLWHLIKGIMGMIYNACKGVIIRKLWLKVLYNGGLYVYALMNLCVCVCVDYFKKYNHLVFHHHYDILEHYDVTPWMASTFPLGSLFNRSRK